MKTRMLSAFLAGACFAGVLHAASPPLVVHEWGTFTSFQDAAGKTIAGINVDDEPVPKFVHRLKDFESFQTTSMPAIWFQGAPPCYPGVTLRLETPVLYFYPPAGWQAKPFDVRATFIGGWLTEFYPAATTEGMDVLTAVDARAQGSLHWRQLRLDPAAASLKPKTDSHVWLAPREVRSSIVVNDSTKEAEKYLFYRGVGNLDAPIVVRQEGDKFTVSLRDGESRLERLPRLWIVEVSPDKRVRHQTLEPKGRSVTAPAFPKSFGSQKSSLEQLQRELAAALTSEGLYADEAAAMLATWRLSYFESEGLRVFFLLPQPWTDARLPLSISTPADITRVMVGRVELVTAHQREVLRQLYALPDEAFDVIASVRGRIAGGIAAAGRGWPIAFRSLPCGGPRGSASRCSSTNRWAAFAMPCWRMNGGREGRRHAPRAPRTHDAQASAPAWPICASRRSPTRS